MDKRFKWPVHPKPYYSDLPYHAAYLPYRGAVAGGGVPYYIHSPYANKNFSRLHHGYHTGTSRPNKYHKPPPIGGPSQNAYTGRRSGGAPPSGGASSTSSDVVTLIVDNNNLKRLIVLHVNMLQEQSEKLDARDKEIEEHNLKINKLFAQNDELTRTQARLEAELMEARSQLRRKQQMDDHHHEDDDDDDDDDDDELPKPPAKIVRHVETQTDFDLELPEPKRLKAINAHQEIAEENQLYLQQRQQQLHREQHKSQAEERLVAEQVRPEPQPSLAQLMKHTYDNHPHLLQCEVPNVLVTSVTNLSPATPIDTRREVGRGEFKLSGKKVSTMFLHRVNQDSSLTTTTNTTIISSNHIEKLDQMQVNHVEEEVHMKVQEKEQEHETSKVEMFNDVETHEMEVVSETIVGAEEEVVEEVVIHEETKMVEDHVLEDQLVDKEHNVDEQLVVEEEHLVETEHIENDLAKETEKLVEEQLVETNQSIEHHLVEKEQIVDEQMVEKEEQVVEEQLVEEEQIVEKEQIVEEEQVVDQEQVVDHEQVVEEHVVEEQVVEEQVVEEQVVEEQVLEEQVLEEQVLEEQVVEEQVVEEQVVEDHLMEQQVAEEHEIHTTDANGHMELDEEEEIKVNNVDAHSPHPGDKHQIFGLNATDSPSAHSTPNHQLKKQLQTADEEDQQQGQLVQDGQVEMEVSTLEYFTDDGTQEEFEIHSEQVVTIDTQTDETDISNDFRISPTITNDTQAAPKSISVPAPSTPPPASPIYNQPAPKTAKINSLAVAPNSKKVKKAALPSKIMANHKAKIKAHHEDLQEPLKKILKLKLRQCVMPTKSTTAVAQQDKVTNFTHLSNDNHEISIEEQTRRKLQEHLEKQQRRQSQTPMVLLKKKSSDEVSNTSLIFPPTATTITPAPTPITTPSTTPDHTPTSSIESAPAVVGSPSPLVVAAAAETALPPTKSVTTTEENSTQSQISAPLTPQSMSSASSGSSTSTTTSNRKTPNNLHQTYGKNKTRSITSGGFLTVSYPYTTRSWEDQDIHCDNEFFLEEADELLADNPSLEIPKWHDTPVPASSDNKDIESLSDADFMKRHEKYVKDEIERKRRDERFLREQIRSQELRMRHKQDEVLLPLDPLPISTFYPLPEDIEGVQFVNEVPVQVFGDNMPTLNPNDEFNLPWIEEENADTATARAKAQAKPVSTLASKKLPTTAAEQKHQELNSSFVFIKRRKRRKAGKSGVFGGT